MLEVYLAVCFWTLKQGMDKSRHQEEVMGGKKGEKKRGWGGEKGRSTR